MKTQQQINSILTRGMVNLEANQQGKITDRQIARLRHDMREARGRYNQQIALSGLVFLIVTVILALMPFVIIPVIFVPLIWVGGVISWYIYAWYQQKPIRDDIADRQVASVTGYIDKSRQHGYHIIVDAVTYATPPDMYDAFNDTARYAVYVTPRSHIVLSAEVIDEPIDDYQSDETDSKTSPYTDGRF